MPNVAKPEQTDLETSDTPKSEQTDSGTPDVPKTGQTVPKTPSVPKLEQTVPGTPDAPKPEQTTPFVWPYDLKQDTPNHAPDKNDILADILKIMRTGTSENSVTSTEMITTKNSAASTKTIITKNLTTDIKTNALTAEIPTKKTGDSYTLAFPYLLLDDLLYNEEDMPLAQTDQTETDTQNIQPNQLEVPERNGGTDSHHPLLPLIAAVVFFSICIAAASRKRSE